LGGVLQKGRFLENAAQIFGEETGVRKDQIDFLVHVHAAHVSCEKESGRFGECAENLWKWG
jgi:hypothetical protein